MKHYETIWNHAIAWLSFVPFGLTICLSLVCQIPALVTRALLLELRLRLRRLKLTQLHFSDPFAQDRQTQTASLCDLVYWLDLSDLSDLSSLGHFHAHSFDAATHKIRTNSNHWNRLGRWCFRCFGISWRHWRHSAFFEARCSPRSRPQTLRRNTVVIRRTSFHKHVMHVMPSCSHAVQTSARRRPKKNCRKRRLFRSKTRLTAWCNSHKQDNEPVPSRSCLLASSRGFEPIDWEPEQSIGPYTKTFVSMPTILCGKHLPFI